MRPHVIAFLAASLVTSHLGAQAPAAAARPAGPTAPPSERDLMIADWERDRDNVLAYAAAIPDSAVGFRATKGVRTFAEQIEHLASTNVQVVAVGLEGRQKLPVLGDSARYLHDRDALVAYARASYDYVLGALRAATPAQLARTFPLFGEPPARASRWLQLSREHTAWTLGQTVPYLRLNGATPPSYKLPL